MKQGKNGPLNSRFITVKKELLQNSNLYLMILLPLIWLIIFCYGPMGGLWMAFTNFRINTGIFGSKFVGLAHFVKFFKSPSFLPLLRNTFLINIYSLAFGFPIPVILALSLNMSRNQSVKKTVQMITYAPFFISTVVMVSIINQFLSYKFGLFAAVVRALGSEPVDLLGMGKYFRHVFVWTGVWQTMGWSSIIYIGALSSISLELHEAAIVDGCTRLQRIWHIDIPGIMPTMVIQLILNVGNIMNIGFEKIYLMQNPANQPVSEVIPIYIYKNSILSQFPDYSYTTAVGLFNSVISIILLIAVNQVARRLNETSLW
jgi:ABC-type polysaccharide transport system permease subunit